MRVLLVENYQTTIDKIKNLLNSKEIIIDTCGSKTEMLELCKLYEYNLIIIEQMLDSIDGDHLIEELRNDNIKTPVLAISKTENMSKRISALRKGADDFIVEPFDNQEFLARIKAIIRRANGYAQNKIKSGDLEINLSEQKAYFKGSAISLTKKEYMILEFLFLKKGSTLNKERFLNHLYSGNDEPEAKIIDVFICKLRRKIEKISGGESFIETDWGRGYYLLDKEQ
ncbi:MAG: response regulator transcription factor [Alphaproteobacteria bacterium]|jgi:two-component system cell cycle response regulator CtrA|nr:response regulator transcription factor [Alphaproteobacteria bacterium]